MDGQPTIDTFQVGYEETAYEMSQAQPPHTPTAAEYQEVQDALELGGTLHELRQQKLGGHVTEGMVNNG